MTTTHVRIFKAKSYLVKPCHTSNEATTTTGKNQVVKNSNSRLFHPNFVCCPRMLCWDSSLISCLLNFCFYSGLIRKHTIFWKDYHLFFMANANIIYLLFFYYMFNYVPSSQVPILGHERTNNPMLFNDMRLFILPTIHLIKIALCQSLCLAQWHSNFIKYLKAYSLISYSGHSQNFQNRCIWI